MKEFIRRDSGKAGGKRGGRRFQSLLLGIAAIISVTANASEAPFSDINIIDGDFDYASCVYAADMNRNQNISEHCEVCYTT